MKTRRLSSMIAVLAMTLVLIMCGSLLADEITVDIPSLPVTITEDAQGFAEFSGENIQYLSRTGEPMLPYQVVSVLLPPDADLATVSASVVGEELEEMPGYWEVRPKPPMATWDGSEVITAWPEDKMIVDGYDVEIYNEDALFPASVIGRISTGMMRKWRMVDVPIAMSQYNPLTKQLYRLINAQLVVSYWPEPGVLSAADSDAVFGDRIFEGVVEDSTVNFDEVAPLYETLAQEAMAAAAGERYVIITTSAISSSSSQLDDFVSHKQARGFTVQVATQGTWGGGSGNAAAENIRSWLKNNYQSRNIKYVLLIGNPDPSSGDVPMKMLWPRNYGATNGNAPSDYYYADLTGYWDVDGDGYYGEWHDFYGIDRHYEVLVGRIPYYGNTTDLDNILAKIIDYENTSEGQAGWRKNVLLPMEPVDEYTPSYHLGEAIKYLLGLSWDYHRVYDGTFGLTPPPETVPCTVANVTNAWNGSNFGAIFWSTHGSSTMANDVMDLSHAQTLDDNHPGFTFQDSCKNAYPEVTNNLAYSLLKNGAIGTVGATRVCWYTPGQTSFNNSATGPGMTYEYARRLIQSKMASGYALYYIKNQLYPSDRDEWMNFAVFNLYGCPATGLFSFALPQPQPTVNISASPSTITQGQSSTLSWTSTNASSATINQGIGSVPVNGSTTVWPTQTTTYTVTVTGPGGTDADSVTVTVSQYPRPTVSISASPNTILLGESSTVTWSSTNTDSATVEVGIGGTHYNVPVNGSQNVTPDKTTTYTITVTGPGGTATDSVTVTVNYICECNLVPDATVVPIGGTLGFQATVKNNTDKTGGVLFATKVTKPDGSQTGWVKGPLTVYLNPYQSKSGHFTHIIPLDFDLGTYTYHGYVGKYGTIYHECQFAFMVTEKPDFTVIWQKTYGGGASDFAYSVQETAGGGYIVGGRAYSYDGALLLSLDPNGEIPGCSAMGTSQAIVSGTSVSGQDTDVVGENTSATVSNTAVSPRTVSADTNEVCSASSSLWGISYEGTSIDAMQQTSDGGYIVAGQTYTYGAGGDDIWVSKLNSDGTAAWQNTYGGSDDEHPHCIQQTDDGGYILTGCTRSFGTVGYDVWVLKLNPNGTVAWQKIYGGATGNSGSDWGQCIQQTADGGYIVLAATSDDYTIWGGDFWVLKLNSNGTIAWQKAYRAFAMDWPNSIQQTADGGYVVAGDTYSFGAGMHDWWVLKLNSNGTIAWQKAYGGGGWEYSPSIQQTADDGYIVAGYTYASSFGIGDYDAWVVKLNSDGTIASQTIIGGSGDDRARSIRETTDGGYVVAGGSSSFGSSSGDFWILKLQPVP